VLKALQAVGFGVHRSRRIELACSRGDDGKLARSEARYEELVDTLKSINHRGSPQEARHFDRTLVKIGAETLKAQQIRDKPSTKHVRVVDGTVTGRTPLCASAIISRHMSLVSSRPRSLTRWPRSAATLVLLVTPVGCDSTSPATNAPDAPAPDVTIADDRAESVDRPSMDVTPLADVSLDHAEADRPDGALLDAAPTDAAPADVAPVDAAIADGGALAARIQSPLPDSLPVLYARAFLPAPEGDAFIVASGIPTAARSYVWRAGADGTTRWSHRLRGTAPILLWSAAARADGTLLIAGSLTATQQSVVFLVGADGALRWGRALDASLGPSVYPAWWGDRPIVAADSTLSCEGSTASTLVVELSLAAGEITRARSLSIGARAPQVGGLATPGDGSLMLFTFHPELGRPLLRATDFELAPAVWSPPMIPTHAASLPGGLTVLAGTANDATISARTNGLVVALLDASGHQRWWTWRDIPNTRLFGGQMGGLAVSGGRILFGGTYAHDRGPVAYLEALDTDGATLGDHRYFQGTVAPTVRGLIPRAGGALALTDHQLGFFFLASVAPDGALPGACEAFTLPTRFVRRAEGSLYPPSSATWTTCAAPSSIPLAVTWDDASPRVERSCIR
jgi:hypothetical protein